MINVIVNEKPMSVGDATVAALIASLAVPDRGVAVAVNGEVVRRVDWGSRRLAEGDVVDVLTAAQGG